MLKIIHNITNKISVLISFTPFGVVARKPNVNTFNATDLPFLTIEEIEKLKIQELQSAYKSFNSTRVKIQKEIKKMRENCKTLGLKGIDFDVYDKETVNTKWRGLQQQLQNNLNENKEKEKEKEERQQKKVNSKWRDLKQQVKNNSKENKEKEKEKEKEERQQKLYSLRCYIVRRYIYLLCTHTYLNTLYFFTAITASILNSNLVRISDAMFSFLHNPTEEKRYLSMAGNPKKEKTKYLRMFDMLKAQSDYIVELDALIKNEAKYNTNKFIQKEPTKMYQITVETHKKNVKYIPEELTKMHEITVETHKKNVKYIPEELTKMYQKTVDTYNKNIEYIAKTYGQACLLLTIKDIEKLPQEKLIFIRALVKTSEINFKQELTQMSKKLKTLELPKPCSGYNNILKIRAKLTSLKHELAKQENNEELKQQISLLEYYIYLWYKYHCVQKLGNLMDSVLNHATKETKYENMAYMLISKNEYIREMFTLHKNIDKHIEVLPDRAGELHKTKEDINKMYDQMVYTYNKNVKYIEFKCDYDTQECLLLTIGKIEQLPQATLILIKALVKTSGMNFKHELTKISQTLETLGLEEAKSYYKNINIAENTLTSLIGELENQENNKELKTQVSLLVYYIYLWYKSHYTTALCNFIYSIVHDETEETRYKYMSDMLTAQSEYSIAMEKLQKNQYKGILTDYTDELHKTQEEVTLMYKKIVDIHKKNNTHIQSKHKYTTKRCLLLTIDQLKQLKKEKSEKLDSIYDLADISEMESTNKLTQISQTLETLGLEEAKSYDKDITKAEKKLTSLKSELENQKNNEKLKKQVALLAYYVYLWRKSNYITALFNFIDSILDDHPDDKIYENMKNVLIGQNEYLIEMKHFYKNGDKYIEILPNRAGELKKEIEEINKISPFMEAQFKENVKYIEQECNYTTQKCILLTIKKINTFKTKKLHLVYGLLRTSLINFKQELTTISRKLETLGLKEAKSYHNDGITKAENTLNSLIRKLENQNNNEKLKKQVALLAYYIYLWRKSDCIITLCNFIYSILNNATEEKKYKSMSAMLIRQNDYLIEMAKSKNNKYKGLLTDDTNELHKKQEEVTQMYEKIVDIHKDNITYIKNTEPYNKHEGLLSIIKNIEEQQLSLAESVLVDDFERSPDQSNQVSKSEVSYHNKNTQKVIAPLDQLNVFPLNSNKKNEEEKQKTKILEQKQHTEQKPNKLMNIICASILFLGLGLAYIIFKYKKKSKLPKNTTTNRKKIKIT